MGRHTMALSDDWSTCTRCNEKLKHGVCPCCGAGTKHVCGMCVKKKKKGKDWGWAIGDNKGCDEHPYTEEKGCWIVVLCAKLGCNNQMGYWSKTGKPRLDRVNLTCEDHK